MKRKHKQYSRPKKAFDKERILEEEEIKKEFGLKNKKEIWTAEARIGSIRDMAKRLIPAKPEEQSVFFERLKKMGFNVNSIADALSLNKKDYLKRRLQTIVVAKKISTTQKGARQLITHKKILVDRNIIDSPSYIIPVSLENKISLKQKNKSPKIKTQEEMKIEVSAEAVE
ncbi:30S ribosomal protein S4 [Candidatus Pacearchaeota archaeon CG10_big_fil_rev_8_21_14_0_10_34_12]|nr:MAG: 30S ribosomal protein S4 [Candidatus Pacearchaeota archaeon CG10_big_fil_rev_8_21_14_0_10_34_12]